jgi:spermidine synthase
MDLWYTENHTANVRFGMKVTRHLYSEKSEFQQVDILDTVEFGRILTLDGLMMVNQKDEFVYHDMIVHVAMASNPDIKNVLVIGGGDGGTVRELTRYDSITHIDMVEIDKLVVDSCLEFIPQTSCKLKEERVSLFFQDGLEIATMLLTKMVF